MNQRSSTRRTAREILVVEDETSIADIVCTALRHHGYATTHCENGKTALALATEQRFDLIVLDVMVPGLGGFEVCRQLRDRGNMCPVIFLTARDEHENRVRGFRAGGDDYLTKPFSVDEFVLRVAAILRRAHSDGLPDVITVADLTLSESDHQVHRAGHSIDLSPTEFRLLHYLMVNPGTTLSKAQIVLNVWDYAYDGGDNVVELYIGYLRRKLGTDLPPLIHTRRGVGYVLRAEVT